MYTILTPDVRVQRCGVQAGVIKPSGGGSIYEFSARLAPVPDSGKPRRAIPPAAALRDTVTEVIVITVRYRLCLHCSTSLACNRQQATGNRQQAVS